MNKHDIKYCLVLVKICLLDMFISLFGWSVDGSSASGHIKFVFLNKRPCQVRPTLVDISSNESLYYSFTVSVNKCGRSGNTMMIHMLEFLFRIK